MLKANVSKSKILDVERDGQSQWSISLLYMKSNEKFSVSLGV